MKYIATQTFSLDVNIILVHDVNTFFIMVLLDLNDRCLSSSMDIKMPQLHLCIILGEPKPELVCFILTIF
jgi:hypothetical protein